LLTWMVCGPPRLWWISGLLSAPEVATLREMYGIDGTLLGPSTGVPGIR
jgi:hypothetical protein